ncbi:MAG: CHAD domain-containing protein [Fimbriiglobus sp.]|jgi:CHAD domain-containing protein|nr:CHAD domain-containing protein [Fimbriiglobus sp.]
MTTSQLADLPAKKAARRVLTEQFESVRERLLAAFAEPTEPERIHKLRVALRRATAALDAFAPCLPRRIHKHARRELRSIRRTAGAARDWDVFVPVVLEWASAQPETVRSFADALLGWSASKRDSAQTALLGLIDVHPAGLEATLTQLLDHLRRPKGDPTAADLGRERVEILQAELTAAIEHEPTTDEEYHEVRIVGKRLRYAVELIAELLPEADRIDADMRALQESLGHLNDAVVGESHRAAFVNYFLRFHPAEWERLKPGADALAAHFAAVREAERGRFREWRERTSHNHEWTGD